MRKLRRTASVAAVAAWLSSCAPVDRWGAFEVEWDPLAEHAAAPEDLARRYAPRQSTPPDDPAVSAQGPLELTIEQAVLLALRRNRDLAIEQLAPVVAGAFELAERGVFDPEVFAEGRFGKVVGSETARSTEERFEVDARDSEAAAGVRQRLPTGTELEAAVGHARGESNRTPTQQEARLGLTVTQPLLRGRGSAVGLARVRLAELDVEASVHQLRAFTEALVEQAEVAYWEFALARESISIFDRALELARRQTREIEERIRVGVLPETEAFAASAEAARREQDLIDARSDLEARRLRLLQLIAPEDDAYDPEVDPITPIRTVAPPIEDLSKRQDLAVQHRADLAEARVRRDQGRLEVVATETGLLPRLDLFLAVGKTGFSETAAGAFRDLDGDGQELAVGLEFSHPLGRRTARGLDDAARASSLQADLAVRNLRRRALLDVRLAVNEAERARRQIAATRSTRDLQERTHEAERRKFDVGASTALLVGQAQRDLLGARIAEVDAVVRYRMSLVRLFRAEGSLLRRRGIVVGSP